MVLCDAAGVPKGSLGWAAHYQPWWSVILSDSNYPRKCVHFEDAPVLLTLCAGQTAAVLQSMFYCCLSFDHLHSGLTNPFAGALPSCADADLRGLGTMARPRRTKHGTPLTRGGDSGCQV